MTIRAGGQTGDEYNYPAQKAAYWAKIDAEKNQQECAGSPLIGVYAFLTVCAVGSMSWYYDFQKTNKQLCVNEAPHVTATTNTNIFNRCSKVLPDGTILVWDGNAQQKKEIESIAAPRPK